MFSGNVVLTDNLLRDIWISIKMMFGGEIKFYTKIVEKARTEAILRMQEKAHDLNAQAVLCVRIESSSIHPGTIEILAYGTAVKVSKSNSANSK